MRILVRYAYGQRARSVITHKRSQASLQRSQMLPLLRCCLVAARRMLTKIRRSTTHKNIKNNAAKPQFVIGHFRTQIKGLGDQGIRGLGDQRVRGQRIRGLEDQGIRGLEDQRVSGLEDQRIRGLEGQRISGLEDQRVRGLEGQRVRGLEGQRLEDQRIWKIHFKTKYENYT